MKIFIDSADLEEIKQAFEWQIVDGITTNPSLIKKAIAGQEIDMMSHIIEVLSVARNRPVSLEVDGFKEGVITSKQLVYEVRQLNTTFKKYNSLVNFKIPVNPALEKDDENHFDGLIAIKELAVMGIPINATLIMTPEQALLAAKAGARYLSPFMGRVDDYNARGDMLLTGIQLVRDIIEIMKNYDFDTEIIGASVREIKHVRAIAKMGVDIATIPFKVIREMIVHPKTYEGVAKFRDDMVEDYKKLLK